MSSQPRPNEDANDNASDGAANADDGINNSNASDAGLEHASDDAAEGAGNAEGEHGPEALPTQAEEHGPEALPTQANEHADDAGSNAADPEPGVSDNANVPSDVQLPDEATDPPGGEHRP